MCCCGPASFRGVRKSVLSLIMILAWIAFGCGIFPLFGTWLAAFGSVFFDKHAEREWAQSGAFTDMTWKMSTEAPLLWGLLYSNGLVGFIRTLAILRTLQTAMELTLGITGCFISKAETFRPVRVSLGVFLAGYLVLLGLFVYWGATFMQVGNLKLSAEFLDAAGPGAEKGGMWILRALQEWATRVKVSFTLVALVAFPAVFAPVMALFGPDLEPQAPDAGYVASRRNYDYRGEYAPGEYAPLMGPQQSMVGPPVAAGPVYYPYQGGPPCGQQSAHATAGPAPGPMRPPTAEPAVDAFGQPQGLYN